MLNNENLKDIMNKLSKTQSLVIAGDFWQLDCVEGTPMYNNWTKRKSDEYEKFTIRELTKNWRQKEDKEFFSLCNDLRNKLTKSKAKKLIDILNTRVKKLPPNDTLNDIHICGINSQVDRVNKDKKMDVGCKVISTSNCNDLEKNKIPKGYIGIVLKSNKSDFSIQFDSSSGENVSTFKSIKNKFKPAQALTIHKAQGKTMIFLWGKCINF
jgi:ATP-dependent exoDNAse (exonuclease V) alpha subunit